MKVWAVTRGGNNFLTFTIHRLRSGAIVKAVTNFCEASANEARGKSEHEVFPLWSPQRLTQCQKSDWADLRRKHGFMVVRIEINAAKDELEGLKNA